MYNAILSMFVVVDMIIYMVLLSLISNIFSFELAVLTALSSTMALLSKHRFGKFNAIVVNKLVEKAEKNEKKSLQGSK